MYGIDQVLNGLTYSVLFFSTFVGNFHPFTPQKPIDLEEMYNPQRRAYYLAWYINDEPDPAVKNSDPKLIYRKRPANHTVSVRPTTPIL
jgi:hypothetical protein